MFNHCKLGDVLRLHRGYDITKAQQLPGSYPVISSSGVTSWHSEYKRRGPGVVIGRKGSLGTAFYVNGPYWPHDTTLYVEDFLGNHPRYCYYLLKTLGLERYDVGASNPTLNRNHLHEVDVIAPSSLEQARIAEVLAAYDDLIENNTRRIAVLEEMARRIFEEWFVHFRAPGCEGLPLVESELGPIPQGWGVKAIGSVFTTGSGGTPSRKRDTYFGGEINWVKTKELLDCPIFSTEEKITQEGLENSSAKIFPAYTVLVGMYGANIGQLGVLVEPAATNQACCAIISKAAPGWAFCYLTLQNARGRLIGLRAGAAQQNVSQAIIRDFPVTVGPDQIHTRFERVVAPIIGLSFSLYRQIANLRAQRDLLLPKLTSGEIDLTEAAALPQAAE